MIRNPPSEIGERLPMAGRFLERSIATLLLPLPSQCLGAPSKVIQVPWFTAFRIENWLD